MNQNLGEWAMCCCLFANEERGRELTYALLALFGCLMMGTAVVLWIARRLKRTSQDDADDLLACYRDLMQEGELNQEEYDRITRAINSSTKNLPTSPKPPKSQEET